MPRLTTSLAAGVFLAGLALLLPSTATAQEKKNTETVKFETVDAVDLKGTYWPSVKAKKAPVAILLHKIGGKSKDAGWPELAEELQKAGFAVLAFDFRGHGESTSVGAAFWNHPMNQNLRKPPAAQQTSVDMKTFPATYYPNLVNDIAAAKRFIERRYNDTGECNCSNIVLIGAEDGATLGALWLASETKRYRIIPVGLAGQKNERPESKDVIACVWLSMSESLGSGTVRQYVGGINLLNKWLRDAGNTKESKLSMTAESKIPMAFIYGKKEPKPDSYVRLVKAIRPTYVPGNTKPDTDELKGTLEKGINTNLAGHKLLVGELDTRERIVDAYLTKFILDEKKGLNEWEKRESSDNAYSWYFPGVRMPVKAAMKGEKYLMPVPLQPFGLR
jgi:alpha-beta hydrolase superfamily lysophospholipase